MTGLEELAGACVSSASDCAEAGSHFARLSPAAANPLSLRKLLPGLFSARSVIFAYLGNGLQLFIVNSELRFPIPVMNNLGGVLFYDGGNVYRHIRVSDLIDNYTHTVGFGFRYNTPIGPVRFDIGHLLEPVPGLRSTQFFITIGQAF